MLSLRNPLEVAGVSVCQLGPDESITTNQLLMVAVFVSNLFSFIIIDAHYLDLQREVWRNWNKDTSRDFWEEVDDFLANLRKKNRADQVL